MKTKILGNTDLELSIIGLGTWAIGGDWYMGWGPQDDKESIATILEAMEAGINWIDTAPAYGFGHAEEVVGRAIKEWRDSVTVATKCGVLPNEDKTVKNCIKSDSIIKEAEDSLRRLGVEVIDLYQIHWPNPDEDIEEAFKALQSLKKQGKIRWAGVSNFSVEELERISPIGQVSSLQPPYSLLNRSIEEEILPWCSEHDTGVICYSPMENGLLTGKLSPQWAASLPDTDWRKIRWMRLKKVNFFEEPELSALIGWIDCLKEISARRGYPVSHLAINWTLRRPEVTAAIVGARKKGQISETARASDWSLSEEEIEEIEASYLEYQKSMGR